MKTDDDRLGSVFVVLLVIAGAVGGVAMVCTGARDIAIQHRAQTTWLPVEGRVTKVSVQEGERFRGKAAILNLFYLEQKVVVVYSFKVGENTYVGNTVAPPAADSDRGRRGWADEVAAQFKEHARCEVYYDPSRPSHSYLVRGTTSNSYGRVVIGLFLAILCGVVVPGAVVVGRTAKRGILFRPRALAATEQDGWSEVLPGARDGLRNPLLWSVPLALVWIGGVGATSWHYFAEGVRPLRWGYLDLGVFVLAVGMALVLFIAVCRQFVDGARRRRTLNPPRVYLRTAQLAPGTSLEVCVEQSVREPGHLKHLTASLVNPATDTREAFVEVADRDLSADEPLHEFGDLVIGQAAAPVLMRIEVCTELADGTSATAIFPLWAPGEMTVRASEEEEVTMPGEVPNPETTDEDGEE